MKSAHLLKNFLPPIFFVLMGCTVFLLLRPVKERERKDENSCYALDIQEFSCREISVFAMGISRNMSNEISVFAIGMSRNMSLCDKALLPRRLNMILASTWFVRLVP